MSRWPSVKSRSPTRRKWRGGFVAQALRLQRRDSELLISSRHSGCPRESDLTQRWGRRSFFVVCQAVAAWGSRGRKPGTDGTFGRKPGTDGEAGDRRNVHRGPKYFENVPSVPEFFFRLSPNSSSSKTSRLSPNSSVPEFFCPSVPEFFCPRLSPNSSVPNLLIERVSTPLTPIGNEKRARLLKRRYFGSAAPYQSCDVPLASVSLAPPSS
jgi:hypothetical protein